MGRAAPSPSAKPSPRRLLWCPVSEPYIAVRSARTRSSVIALFPTRLLTLLGPFPREGDHGEGRDANTREAVKHLLALTGEAADLQMGERKISRGSRKAEALSCFNSIQQGRR